MSELLSCPFCGGEAEIYVDNILGDVPSCKDLYSVYCKECESSTAYKDIEQEAIDAWNRRA